MEEYLSLPSSLSLKRWTNTPSSLGKSRFFVINSLTCLSLVNFLVFLLSCLYHTLKKKYIYISLTKTKPNMVVYARIQEGSWSQETELGTSLKYTARSFSEQTKSTPKVLLRWFFSAGSPPLPLLLALQFQNCFLSLFWHVPPTLNKHLFPDLWTG